MSLYGQYIKERLNKDIVEDENGFATYYFIIPSEAVYIEDVYVIPGQRRQRVASCYVSDICEKAKAHGMKKAWVSVAVKSNNPSESIKAILAYGFKLIQANQEALFFEKEI